MADPVRVGIIGTGSIARDQHAPACLAAANAQLHSVLSRDSARAQDFIREFDETARPFTDIDQFLSDPELDAVVVTSPDSFHFAHARMSLEAGKHTLVEKPLTLRPQEGRQLITIAKQRRQQLGVGFHLRWHPAIRQIIELVKAGEIGKLRHLNMRWTFHRTSTEDWRSNPEISRWWSLSGVGAHCIDLLRLFTTELGYTRSTFHASSIRGVLGGGNEETSIITTTFEEGATAVILSTVLFPAPSELALFGEGGNITAIDVLGRANPGKLTLNGHPVPYVFENPYVAQLENFCSSILTHSPYSVPGETGLDVLLDLDSIGERGLCSYS